MLNKLYISLFFLFFLFFYAACHSCLRDQKLRLIIQRILEVFSPSSVHLLQLRLGEFELRVVQRRTAHDGRSDGLPKIQTGRSNKPLVNKFIFLSILVSFVTLPADTPSWLAQRSCHNSLPCLLQTILLFLSVLWLIYFFAWTIIVHVHHLIVLFFSKAPSRGLA